MPKENKEKRSDKPPSPKRTNQRRLSLLRHFESMDRINRALQGTSDLEQAMKDVLDVLLALFECDRSWLVYPCDPESLTWQVAMERTRPEYPGLLPIGIELPLEPIGSTIFRILRSADGPVKFGAREEHPVPKELEVSFKIQSFIAMAFYPKVGKPWSFGLHQCSYARVWTEEEERLFQDVGRRLSDALSSLLAFRNLQESEKQIKHLIDASPVAMVVSSGIEEHVEWVNDKFIELFGYTAEDMPDVEHWWPLAYPNETYQAEIRAQWKARVERAIRDKGQSKPMEATVRCKDGSYRYVEFRLSSIGEKHLITFVDLTEHKQAEAQLLASEQLFRALVENSPDFIARYDREFHRIYVNPAIQKLFGVPPENVIGKTPADQSPVYAPQAYIDHLRQVIETGTERAMEMPFRTEQGEMHWGHMRFVPEMGPGGKVESVLAIGRDIHEIKENERRFQMLAENFPDPIMRLDRDGRHLYVNPAFEKVFGLPAKSIIGKTLEELHPSSKVEQNDTLLIWIRRAFDDGIANETEVNWDTYIGERIFENRYIPEKDATGNVVTVLCIAHDLTEHKLAEKALRESEERYRMLFNIMDEGVAVNEIIRDENDEVVDYVIMDVNPAFTKNSAFTREQVLGRRATEIYHMSPEFIRDWWKKHTRMQQVVHTEMHYAPADRWFHITTTPPEGKRFATFSVDITERKHADEALRESEERYRQLVNLSPEAIAVYNQGQIVFANPAAIQMVGAKSTQDLIGRSILDFIPPHLQAIVRKRMEEVESTGVSIPFVEEKFLRLDGSTVDVEVGVVPYTFQGVRYIQIVARNITERKRHELEREAIVAVSSALRQATTSEDILSVILDELIGLFKADGAVMVLPDAQTKGLIDEMGRGPVGERMIGLNIPPGAGVANWVIENQKPYLNNHIDENSLFYRPDLLGESRCLASVPLIAQEQPIGALWIARKTDVTEQELRLLNAIADIAANAVHRVKLHEQTVQQLHHLIALHQIDLAISANFDLYVTLNVILKSVKDELKVDAASILRLNTVTHTLDYAEGIGFRTHRIEQSHVRLGNGCAGRAAQEYRTVSYPNLQSSAEAFSRSSLLADEEFLSHYATPLIVKGQVKGVLEIFHRKPFESGSEWIDYFETLATQVAIAIESASLFENLQRSNLELRLAYDATIEGWSRALDLRDKETEGHTQRVTEKVLQLADRMGMRDAEKLDLRRGALLHDIGKMGVPDAILLKTGSLSALEWEIMKQHPTFAYQMLSPIAYLKYAVDIPYCHHERWDGSGYPRGLKGEEIPLSARMFSVVDVFDALTSNRPYRVAWTHEQAYRYIQEEAGRQFDPQIIKIFLDTK